MEITKAADILDAAIYSGDELIITTKERGQIIGVPHSVDEFDTDPDRLGYFIMIEPHLGDTVYLDEIVEIYSDDTVSPAKFQHNIVLVSGK